MLELVGVHRDIVGRRDGRQPQHRREAARNWVDMTGRIAANTCVKLNRSIQFTQANTQYPVTYRIAVVVIDHVTKLFLLVGTGIENKKWVVWEWKSPPQLSVIGRRSRGIVLGKGKSFPPIRPAAT